MNSRQKYRKHLKHQAKIKHLRRLLVTGTAVAALATVSFNKTQAHADEVQKDAVKQSTPEPVGDGTAPATSTAAAANTASNTSQATSSAAASTSVESSAATAVDTNTKADQISASSTSTSSTSDTAAANPSSTASATSASAEAKTDTPTSSSATIENQTATRSSSSTESKDPTSTEERRVSIAVSSGTKAKSASATIESAANAADTNSAQNVSSADSQRNANANTADSESTAKTETTQSTAETPAKQNQVAVYAADENPVKVANLTSTQINFLNSIKDAAINGWQQYGVLPSLTAAQAILESGWGQSALAAQYHNLFGIKSSYNGQAVNLPTQEYVNGRYVTINDYFRAYQNNGESLADHSRFLVNNSRYANLLNVKDADTVTRLISQDGYATSPTYTTSLRSLIREYKLTDWDTLAFGSNNHDQTTLVTANDNTKTEPQVVNTYYTVQSGDTLSAISAKYHTTNANLVEWNNLENPNLIYVGASLIVAKTVQPTVVANTPDKQTTPAKTTTTTVDITYTVKAGDSLSAIAAKYNTTVPVLVSRNNIKNANLIYVGQVLVVGTKQVTTTVDTPTVAKQVTTTTNPSTVTTPVTNNTNLAAKPAASATYYTIKAGDTLSGIAAEYHTDVKTLAVNNQIANTNRIYVGQVLLVKGAANNPSSTPSSTNATTSDYTVKSGDTLWALANHHHTTVSELKRHNGLTSDTIYIGQQLKLN